MFLQKDPGPNRAASLTLPTLGAAEIVVTLVPEQRDADTLIADYWASHPRFLFLKNAQPGAKILDFGASHGGMSFWPGWMHPVRDDIAMYAIDIERGFHFDRYAAYDVVDVTKTPSQFADALFDLVVCSLTLEYVEDPRAALREIFRVTRPGGSIFLEYAGRDSVDLPLRKELEDLGLTGDSINFHEDKDHLHLFDARSLSAELHATGFTPVAHGSVRNDRLMPELMSYSVRTGNAETTSYALRLAYRCISYAIADRLT